MPSGLSSDGSEIRFFFAFGQTMPEMNGDVLSKKILKIRPNMPIILCTGYSEEIDEPKALALGIRSFQIKPARINVLFRSIRSIFDTE